MSSQELGPPTLDLPAPAVWVAGRKTGTRVLMDPHQVKLRLKSKDGKFSYYWCSRTEGDQCPVRAVLDREQDMIVKHTGTHNHDSGLVRSVVMDKYKETVANAVANPTVAPRVLYQDLTAAVMEEPSTSGVGLPELPNQRSIARQIQRKRKEEMGLPPVPKTWEEMDVPEAFYSSSDGAEFLILNSTIAGSIKKVWGWASDTGINIRCGPT